MFYYQMYGVFVLFECTAEDNNKWRLTVYKIGERGGWKVLFKKTKKYSEGYTHFKHFSESLKHFRLRAKK